jgi:hypothetical protein
VLLDKAYKGYFIGSHKLLGLWFAYGWVPESHEGNNKRVQGNRIVFVDEANTREEAERRVRQEIERILSIRF